MWPAALTRLFRRRLLFILFGIVMLVYFLTRLNKKKVRVPAPRADVAHVVRTRPLIWRTLQEHLLSDEPDNRTNPPDLQCRNSVQGREYLADDRGFVCTREHILPTGCCNVEVPQTLYYSCQTCDSNTHCCGIYEFCVSCCLHPEKRPLLELALRNIRGSQSIIYSAVGDHFELCLVKCRTSSHSVIHENRYRDKAAKYCYGPTEPYKSPSALSSLVPR